jgi:hypothetical protein
MAQRPIMAHSSGRSNFRFGSKAVIGMAADINNNALLRELRRPWINKLSLRWNSHAGIVLLIK